MKWWQRRKPHVHRWLAVENPQWEETELGWRISFNQSDLICDCGAVSHTNIIGPDETFSYITAPLKN